MKRIELIKKIKKISLLKNGKFKLRSGKISSFYWDKYRFISPPELEWYIISKMCKILSTFSTFNKLAGLELGGALLAKDISSFLYFFKDINKPALFVRKKAKKYGTCNLIEGGFKKGERVVVVEDVITTAGQVVISIKEIEKLGLIIVGVVCVIDRQQGGKERIQKMGYKFISIFTQQELNAI